MSQLQPASPETSRPAYDPGLTRQYTGVLKRAINKDGQFNVRRAGRNWHDAHLYMFLISTSWPLFFVLVTLAFATVNTLFAGAYMAIGIEHLKNAVAPTAEMRFVNAFFFSAHTLTTVGYGNMYPDGVAANVTSAFEALVGLLGFAIATGLMFGRFSRPSARFGFSENMLVSPYSGGTSLQFRVVNRRSNNLIDVEARMMLMTVEFSEGRLQRRYIQLDLERSQVLFFPLTWTIVHPITESSPLYGKRAEDLADQQAELLVMMKAFDETFSQTVQARYSYRYDEIRWGAKFVPAFEVDEHGDLRVEVNRVGEIENAVLPG
ncbi:MAG TPA: ion channel [Bryobacteraceae bacterium]|nr:ion channel [Bryobacteraceae bacterium]